MSKEIDQAVDAYLKEIGTVYHAQFVANMDHHKEWQHDLWSVMLDHEIKPSYGHGQLPKYTTAKVQRFDYKTGIGHRKTIKVKGIASGGAGVVWNNKANQWEKTSPVTPTAASVLYCLLLDADVINYSFSDWCDNYGYSSDSISALHTYQVCKKTADQLAKIFTRQQADHLRDLLQDY